MLIILLAAFQVPETSAPVSQPVAVSDENTVAAAEQPKTRRVCRRTLDSRVGPMAKSQKICREVPVDDSTRS